VLTEEAVVALKFAGEVFATAAAVVGVLWRGLTKVISQKVQEQVAAAMKPLTETTSRQIKDLRTDMKEHHDQEQARADERLAALTTRIDTLFQALTK
jgi:hypothetical protein